MNSSSYFERLVASVEKIARRPYFPGMDRAVDQCLDDVEHFSRTGLITCEQREVLRLVLLGMLMHAA